MARVTYNRQVTALLVIDPYNDFISEGGKVWDRLKAVAEANSCLPHMFQILNEHGKRGFASSMRCIIGTAPAITRAGSISRRSSRQPGRIRLLKMERGVARSVANSPLNRAT